MISEVDIRDMKELYTLNKGDKFKLDADDKEVFVLEKIDGAYSRCFDATGKLYHFAAWTSVMLWPT